MMIENKNENKTEIWLLLLKSFYRSGMLFLKAVQQGVKLLEESM